MHAPQVNSRVRRSQVIVLANVVLKIEEIRGVILQPFTTSNTSQTMFRMSNPVETVLVAALPVLTFSFCPIMSFQLPRIIEAKIAPSLNGPPF